MFISKELKQKNIAEYLLYMWQVEDIIRAHKGDMDELKTNYLSQFKLTDEQRKEEEQWYADLAAMMREEGVLGEGHLQINQNVITWLTDLHLQLLASPKFAFYNAAYFKALPYIVELRSKGGRRDAPELETCFDALYGVMMLKLQHRPVSHDTEVAIADISKLLSMLSAYYKQDKEGTLKLE